MHTDYRKSPILSELHRIVSDWLHRIENNECDERQALSMVRKLNFESNGYYNSETNVNYDTAMKMVGIKDRTKFKRICDQHGIKQVKINNNCIGFNKFEIEALAEEIKKDGDKSVPKNKTK